MTRVLILGATGGTGNHALRQAVARGHDVTVLVRDPSRLAAAAARVNVIAGDVRDAQALDRAVAGQDAVVSALGMGKSFKSGGLIAAAAPAIVASMTRAGVRRLVFTSAFGIGETWRDVPLGPRVFARLLLRDIYADKVLGETAITNSTLDWTLVCPTMLTDKPPAGRYRVGERLALRGFPKISRADVGAFLAAQVEDRSFVGKRVLIDSET